MKKLLIIFTILVTVVSISCKKPAGEGGNSSIMGIVWVVNYNATFTDTLGIYPGADVDVYIIYGDDISYGNKLKTGPDGIFEFPYLRKGNYRIYAYSKDRAAFLAGNPKAPNKAIIKSVEISSKNQIVDAGPFVIYN